MLSVPVNIFCDSDEDKVCNLEIRIADKGVVGSGKINTVLEMIVLIRDTLEELLNIELNIKTVNEVPCIVYKDTVILNYFDVVNVSEGTIEMPSLIIHKNLSKIVAESTRIAIENLTNALERYSKEKYRTKAISSEVILRYLPGHAAQFGD